MSDNNLEQRVADLEKQVQALTKSNTDLIRFLVAHSEGDKLVMAKLFECFLGSETRNDSAFGLLSHSLPDEIRQKFNESMGQALSDRDQIAAMIEAFKSSSLPPSALPPAEG